MIEVVKRVRPTRYEVRQDGQVFKTYTDIGMARRMSVALKWEALKREREALQEGKQP